VRAIARLGAMRARAESRMTSTAAVLRKTGNYVPDPTTDLDVPEWATVIASTPFRLGGANQGGAGTRAVGVGGVEVQVAVRVGHFPASTDLADSDYIDITAGENAGMVLRIVEAAWQDQSTARRVPVVSETRPEEWG